MHLDIAKLWYASQIEQLIFYSYLFLVYIAYIFSPYFALVSKCIFRKGHYSEESD